MGRLEAEPWLRAVLGAFAESVRGLGPVLDVGCGPGTVPAHLAELGLDASGVDLSPRMVEHARRQYPDLRFLRRLGDRARPRACLARRRARLVVAVQPPAGGAARRAADL